MRRPGSGGRCYCSHVQKEVLLAGEGTALAAPGEGVDAPSTTRPTSRLGGIVKRGDVFGMAWVVAAGIALLVPELIHARIIGPFDFLSHIALTKQPGVPVHIFQNGDLIDAYIPWTTIAWHQVHQGHLPIWNPYGGLGTPLAFNWQTAPFSLPSIVGYAVPVRYAFTVGAMVSIVVAGSGAYVLGRVLRMGVVASAAVGTVFELSGPMTAWIGYPFPSVMSWAGWIFAIGLVLLTGRHRARCIVTLALFVAFSMYAGAPEGFTVLAVMAIVFFAYMLITRAEWAGGSGPILKPAVDLAVAGGAGIALAAPLAFPGIQLARDSVRSLSSVGEVLRVRELLYLPFQFFDSSPILVNGHGLLFGYSGVYYTETAMYVGVSALVLAGLAIWVLRRRREVQAFALVTVVCLAVVFVGPIGSLLAKIPLLGNVVFIRALMPMALIIAVLAGYGIDRVVRAAKDRDVARWLGIGFGSAAAGLAVLWLFGRGHLPPDEASIRAHSFIWPTVEAAAGLAAAGFLLWVARERARLQRSADHRHLGTSMQWTLRWSRAVVALGLLAVQTAFLVSAGALMVESSSQGFPQTPATRELAAEVGAARVGFGSRTCQLGIQPNDNGVYGVHELAVYDPILPKKYFTSWFNITGEYPGSQTLNTFCPAVHTVALAREFGVGFVLEETGHAGPIGGVHVRRVGDEELYRIPGAAEATVTPLRGDAFPPDAVVGTPVDVRHPSPSQWQLTTSTKEPAALRLHLTDIPGWHATVDGRPLPLETYAGMMLQARVPAGTHTIALQYWPQTFTVGILVALMSAVFLIGLLMAAFVRKRRRRSDASRSDSPAAPAT